MSELTFASAQALEAISARLDGVFDNAQLIRLGPLGAIEADIKRILAATAPTRAKEPAFAVILEGGCVQCVVANDPNAIGMPYVVVDYDTDGADDDELLSIPQEDGSISNAVGRFDEIAVALIDIGGIKSADTDEPAPGPAVHPLHILLLKSYPNADLLPFDPSDHSAIADMVASNTTGDTLFNFLWREMADLDPTDTEGAYQRIQSALRDIQAVERAFQPAA